MLDKNKKLEQLFRLALSYLGAIVEGDLDEEEGLKDLMEIHKEITDIID